ncbi:FHA domain-containing protein [Streptomyces sp. WMMC500]|uniref:FHA domain-containing protein n=1 Tax=Streptomyces sp. WMMC500 TaxID=3015154 RepID=UPI00248B6833|nr:FHA domain-containing protein [Streptomyces sp. WMMC500]WBB61498.1 FHA domain-containing protein [Streptomyces sp. WMMC500]
MTLRESLARGAAPSPPGTLHARSVAGGIRVAPGAARVVSFGRDKDEVDLCVGEDDQRVSRRHGELSYQRSTWWLRNTGQQLVRLPRGRLMHLTTEPIPLAPGYTPLFVKGSGHREHLVELYVTDAGEDGRVPRHRAETLPPKRWPLSDEERLLLVVLGQQYLQYESDPHPLSYRQAAELLAFLPGGSAWTKRRIEHKVEDVRRRLARGGFPYQVTRGDDGGGPSDSVLKHNLLRGLVESTTLVPPDLELLDDDLPS